MSLLEKAVGKKRAERINEARESARKDFKSKRDAAKEEGKEIPTSYKSSETISGGEVIQKSSQVNTDTPKQDEPKLVKKSKEYNKAIAQKALAKLREKKK